MPSFSDLPNELIEETVKDVYSHSKKQYLGAVSSIFVPFSRRLTFEKVVVRSPTRLGLLCDVAKGSDVVAERRTSLEILFKGDDKDGKISNLSEVTSLFLRLHKLQALAVEGSTTVAKLAVAPMRSNLLPSLRRLQLKDPFLHWAEPFSPLHYVALDRYPALSCLVLDIDRSLASLGRYKPPSPLPHITLRTLALSGRLADTPAVADLIASVPHLTALYLDEFGYADAQGDFAHLLRAVQRPHALQTLRMSRAFPPPEKLSVPLSSFPNLRFLYCTTGISSRLITASLGQHTSLRRLKFGMHSGLRLPDFLTLFREGTRPPLLETVELSELIGWQGYERDDDPEESLGLNVATMEAACAAAKAVGVEITGLSVKWLGELKAKAAAK